MNNSQVAHLWAHQSQDRASGSNFYFEGDKIYSYGSHFCAGKIFDNIVLINSSGYSVTTSGHMTMVRQALSVAYIEVPVPDARYKNDHAANLEHLAQSAKDNLDLAFKRRKNNVWSRDDDLNNCNSHIKNFLGYSEVFKCKTIAKKFNIFKIQATYLQAVNNFDSVAGPYKEMARKQYLKAQAKIDRQAKKDIKRFRNKEIDTVHGLKYALLRMYHVRNREGTILHSEARTSMGAGVLFSDAIKLFNFIVKRKWEKFSDRSMSIGNFYGIALANNVLTIGCHKIQRKEIERFIKQEAGL